jgi:hypothetical protein
VGGLRRQRKGGISVKKTHDYVHHYRGYWSDGSKCRIRIYRENGRPGGHLPGADEFFNKLSVLVP